VKIKDHSDILPGYIQHIEILESACFTVMYNLFSHYNVLAAKRSRENKIYQRLVTQIWKESRAILKALLEIRSLNF
jgi:hypothetical protein